MRNYFLASTVTFLTWLSCSLPSLGSGPALSPLNSNISSTAVSPPWRTPCLQGHWRPQISDANHLGHSPVPKTQVLESTALMTLSRQNNWDGDCSSQDLGPSPHQFWSWEQILVGNLQNYLWHFHCCFHLFVGVFFGHNWRRDLWSSPIPSLESLLLWKCHSHNLDSFFQKSRGHKSQIMCRLLLICSKTNFLIFSPFWFAWLLLYWQPSQLSGWQQSQLSEPKLVPSAQLSTRTVRIMLLVNLTTRGFQFEILHCVDSKS